nr:MAG TPA: hypothetical protein [Caudoviricetes sp.]
MDSAEIHLTTLLHQTPRGGITIHFTTPQLTSSPR